MNKAPAFFKFFIAEFNKIDMKIPVAFARRMGQAFPAKVFLRDRRNNVWTVKVTKVGDCWYFVDGWDKFVDDNLLKSGDLMVFEYFCDCLFNVKVYGPSATEKNAVGPSTLKGAEKQEQVSEYDDIDHGDEETESDRDCAFTTHDHGNKDDHDDDDDEETEDADYMLMRRQEHDQKEVVRAQVMNNGGGTAVGRSTLEKLVYLYPKCYGMELFEAGLAPQPKNPYFVAKIMPKRKSDLFIPMDVIKDYNLKLAQEIVLVDPSGREFRTKCRKWKDGRSILSGGWRRLCRVNFVSLEDTCVCEFAPRRGDQRQLLHISFVRANVMED